jgi:hypothetical protein
MILVKLCSKQIGEKVVKIAIVRNNQWDFQHYKYAAFEVIELMQQDVDKKIASIWPRYTKRYFSEIQTENEFIIEV